MGHHQLLIFKKFFASLRMTLSSGKYFALPVIIQHI